MIALQIQENNRVFGQNVCRREWNIFALLHEFAQLASRTGSKIENMPLYLGLQWTTQQFWQQSMERQLRCQNPCVNRIS